MRCQTMPGHACASSEEKRRLLWNSLSPITSFTSSTTWNRFSAINCLASKEQLQPKLDDAHGRTQAANFPDPWRVWRNGVDTRESNIVRVTEIRRIESIERLGPELNFHSLGDVEVLE